MAAVTMNRDFVKKETILNVGILSKVHVMPPDSARLVLSENSLEKPTQNTFNHLTKYLVGIIDPKASEALPWPLYDSKTERTYRNQLASFISSYSSKGLLEPVMTSYLVNPNCHKVTWLLLQMSQLAVQKVLESKLNKDSKRNLYNSMTTKFKSEEKEGFFEQLESETGTMCHKFSNYLHRRSATEKVAEKIRTKIIEMESKLKSVNAQKFLDDIVDKFISQHQLDDGAKEDILKIKNVHKPAPFFDRWLSEVDRQVEEMESKWSEKMTPFLQTCQETKLSTESLIDRYTGEAEKETYMIEYNHKTDKICTNDLQNQVNSEQKYILKNIVNDETLNFPNLIRGFLIAISYIHKGATTDYDIYQLNERLNDGKRNYDEVAQSMRDVLERVANAEARLEPSSASPHTAILHFPEIPLLPDHTDLRCAREPACQVLFDSFTPISMSKHQFQLLRRTTLHTFVRPKQKLLMPSQASRENLSKRVTSFQVNSDQLNATQNFHNLSVIPQTNRANETIAGSSTGCSKEQLLRLLSTKKMSSSKKFKHDKERSVNIKKAKLFDETISSNEGKSNGLFRSYSSPNLFENREVRSIQRTGSRKLSVMQKNCEPLLEVSGIIALDRDSSCENSRDQSSKNTPVVPAIKLTMDTPPTDHKFHQNLKDFKVDLNNELLVENIPKWVDSEKPVTPQNNPKLTNKTSSLEKIINRYKKVRASVISEDYKSDKTDFRTIVEEKENVFNVNRILLPDLLGPSCSTLSNSPETVEVYRKPRESLGTVLGVDNTFLDQFDLID